MPKLTIEQELKLCEEYTNRKIKEKDLQIKYGICNLSIRNIRKRHNIPRRSKIGIDTIDFDEDYFETIDTPAKSYYLGFISADAHIKPNTLSIGLSIKDISLLENFKKELKSDHSIKFRSKFLKSTQKSYEHCYLNITRLKLYQDLIKHGIGPNKSKELSIPKTISDELIKDFVRGYIDGDGTFSIKKNNQLSFGFVSSVYSFAEELKNYLISKIEINDVIIRTKQGCVECMWGGNIQCKRIFEFLYSRGPWLDRKYKLVSEHLKNYDDDIKTKGGSNLIQKKNYAKNPKILSDLDRILGFGK